MKLKIIDGRFGFQYGLQLNKVVDLDFFSRYFSNLEALVALGENRQFIVVDDCEEKSNQENIESEKETDLKQLQKTKKGTKKSAKNKVEIKDNELSTESV